MERAARCVIVRPRRSARLIPLKDDNPTRTVPFVTVGLIAANLVVFVYELMLPPEASKAFVAAMGVTPAPLTQAALPEPQTLLHGGTTLFQAKLVHPGLAHGARNLLD